MKGESWRNEDRTRVRDRGGTKGRRTQDNKEGGTRNKNKDDLPPPLPPDKWRKDDKGRTMKRKCRFCQKWHMDFDCLSKPASYSISALSYDQMYTSEGEADASNLDDELPTSSSSDTSEEDKSSWRNIKKTNMSYHNVYSNTLHNKSDKTKVPGAS